MKKDENQLRQEISGLVKDYYHLRFDNKTYISGRSQVRYAGRVFDENELQILVDASLDFWLTSGRFSEQFESEFADFVGVEYAMLTNSGSSATTV